MTDHARNVLTALALLVVTSNSFGDLDPLPELALEDQQRTISRSVAKLIEQYHYSQPSLDNSLSSAVFDRYLDSLDGNRIYFLASDVASIGRYRYQLDDRTKSGDLEPVFEIFNLFRERARQRIDYALELLNVEPDFNVEESYRPDRSELPWPTTDAEVEELWRQRVKFDAVNLLLSGETWEEVADVLRDRYERIYKSISQLRSTDAFETYMNAVAHTVDPHSSYLSPHQSEEYRIQMSLSYDGIGARLNVEDDMVTVVEIIPGGPAEIDGRLKPEDRITGVAEGDGEFVDVVGWRIDEVVERIRGPGGTTVRLQILPAGAAPGSAQNVLALMRDKIKLEEQAAQAKAIEVDIDGRNYRVGVIEVPSFYQDFAARSRGEEDYKSTSRDVARLIRDLEADGGIDGLVMDLRENGGGHLSEATELSGLFIDQGPVVQLRETPGNVQVLEDPNPRSVYDGPLVVLVNRYSASASEIFAAAIQDYQRGVIIGQQTFGKGSVQNLFDLDRYIRGSNNGQLTLTTGKYYRITGESTQHRGVTPDVELPSFVDPEVIGESARDTALPWDRIQPTRFRTLPSLVDQIAMLRADVATRPEEDPDFRYLLGNIEAGQETRNRETYSLNLETRRAELDASEAEQLARENARRADFGLAPIAGLDELDASSATAAEIVLDQATRFVAEMAAGKVDKAGPVLSSDSGGAARPPQQLAN